MEIKERRIRVLLQPDDVERAIRHWMCDGCPGSDDIEEEIILEDANIELKVTAGGKQFTAFSLEISGQEET